MAKFPKISSKRIIITFHSIGDLDAVGAAIALSRFLGKKAVIAAPDRPGASARRLLGYTGTPCPLFSEIKRTPSDFIIVLDSSSPKMLPQLVGIIPDLTIDHHMQFGNEIASRKTINDPSASSTCEILHSLLRPKDRISCLALLLGIISDSANFKSASPATFKAASELLSQSGVSYSQLLALSHAPESLSERIEALRSCSSVSAEHIGGHIIAFAMAKSHEAHFADVLVSLGADVAFVGCEGEGSPSRDGASLPDANSGGRISARARDSLKGHVRLDQIMSEVGKVIEGDGGGHEMAAGATGKRALVRESLAVCKKLCEQQMLSSERGKIREIKW
ncbi:MAG: DHH family phosphoesterase [Candidatus Micrarchaeia archaeon]